jgi:hypothetical protein
VYIGFFGITGNHLNFTRNGTSLNLTEIMFEVTRNLAKTMKIDEKYTKNRLIDETINRLI